MQFTSPHLSKWKMVPHSIFLPLKQEMKFPPSGQVLKFPHYPGKEHYGRPQVIVEMSYSKSLTGTNYLQFPKYDSDYLFTIPYLLQKSMTNLKNRVKWYFPLHFGRRETMLKGKEVSIFLLVGGYFKLHLLAFLLAGL